jgi:hypothetical protein
MLLPTNILPKHINTCVLPILSSSEYYPEKHKATLQDVNLFRGVGGSPLREENFKKVTLLTNGSRKCGI